MKLLITLLSIVSCLVNIYAFALPSANKLQLNDSVFIANIHEATMTETNFIMVLESDSVVVMNHGKVTMTGTPAEVFSRSDELIAQGLDVPAIT